MIYRAGDPIPNGDLIKAYILHWLTYHPGQLTPERNRQWHKTEKLMRATLNENATIIPRVHGLEGIKIVA